MAKKGFLIEGYQAGVLGGVQETKPFIDEMGVDKKTPCSCPDENGQRINGCPKVDRLLGMVILIVRDAGALN